MQLGPGLITRKENVSTQTSAPSFSAALFTTGNSPEVSVVNGYTARGPAPRRVPLSHRQKESSDRGDNMRKREDVTPVREANDHLLSDSIELR